MKIQERNSLIHDGERLDDLQCGGLRIIQDPDSFCFGVDAVLLSAFAGAGSTDTILDLGCGNGILPLLLSEKTQAKVIAGLEIRADAADQARRSVQWNGLTEKIRIVTGDIKEASRIFGADSFSVIVTNPPYLAVGNGRINPDGGKAAARHEVLCTFADIARESARILKSGGHFFMIHRPQRLTELLGMMHEAHIEPKRMRLVQPYADREPTMVLLEGLRGGRSGMKIQPALIIYEKPGVYTREVLELYRGRA